MDNTFEGKPYIVAPEAFVDVMGLDSIGIETIPW